MNFFEEDFLVVARLLYQQLEEKALVPAKIINHFQDVESQNVVANMFQTEFKTDMTKEEKEKALNELIVRIKEYSIDHRIKNLSDMSELQKLIQEKEKVAECRTIAYFLERWLKYSVKCAMLLT